MGSSHRPLFYRSVTRNSLLLPEKAKPKMCLKSLQTYTDEEELCCVYVPTNHLYIGDVFLVNTKDVIRPNLSVREGIGEEKINFISLLKMLISVMF